MTSSKSLLGNKQQSKMATNSDAEKLRKQIEVLSNLIKTQRELCKNDNSTNKQQSSVKYSWKKASFEDKNESESSSRNELSHEKKYSSSSKSFTLDRRKHGINGQVSTKTSVLNLLSQTAVTKTSKINKNYNLYESRKEEPIIPSPKPSLPSDNQANKPMLASLDKDTKNSRVFDENVENPKEKNIPEISQGSSKAKDEKSLAASKSLLSARLSSLSSSIAAAKSKLNLESSVVNDTGSKKFTKLSSTTYALSSLSSSSNTKDIINQPSSSSSSTSFSWSKQISNPGAPRFTCVNKPSTLSLKWTNPGTNIESTLRKATNTVRVPNKPCHGSTHVWRSQQSLKLDRRKRKSINLESKGFMRRRQKVVLKDAQAPKKVIHISKYSLVNRKTKNPIKAKKSNKVVIIEGVPYKSSANKLQKTSQAKTVANPKKVKKKSSLTLNIRGEKFLMDVSGKTLTRINPGKTPVGKGPQIDTSREATLNKEGTKGKRRSSVSKVSIGGVMFVQTAPGVLVRSNDAVNKKIASRVVHKSVHYAILSKYKKNVKTKPKSQQYCMFYNRFGKCNKGENCPYIHDPTKIAVCTKFLQGKCTKTDGTCSFSHKIDKDKMPVCQFFLQGNCTNDDCPYSHVNVSSRAAVCQDFIKGYCLNGQQCKKKHILNCEEFSRTGKCSKGKNCNLLHRQRKTKKRRKSSASKEEPKPKRSTVEQMTEEDGFLPLEQVDDNDSSPQDNLTNKPPAEPIVIKPRFLINQDKSG